MNALLSKIFIGLAGLVIISAIGIWLFWEESSSWFNRPTNRATEPGLIFAAIFSN